MKTIEDIQKEIATESARLWALRSEIFGLNPATVASTILGEMVGDVSNMLDNCAELLNQCKK